MRLCTLRRQRLKLLEGMNSILAQSSGYVEIQLTSLLDQVVHADNIASVHISVFHFF
jgi:hypothetical protein